MIAAGREEEFYALYHKSMLKPGSVHCGKVMISTSGGKRIAHLEEVSGTKRSFGILEKGGLLIGAGEINGPFFFWAVSPYKILGVSALFGSMVYCSVSNGVIGASNLLLVSSAKLEWGSFLPKYCEEGEFSRECPQIWSILNDVVSRIVADQSMLASKNLTTIRNEVNRFIRL